MALKCLVVYYSLTGNTRMIAEAISKELGAALLDLRPVKELKAGKFTTYMWGGVQAKMHSTPELQPYDTKVAEYDLILLGTPVWAWTCCPPIRSFIEKEKLAGKKVALWCCAGGDGKKALVRYAKTLPQSTIVGKIIFTDPLINQPEESARRAKDWAKECLQKAG